MLAQEAGVQQGYVQQDDLFFSQLTVRCARPVWPEELPFVISVHLGGSGTAVHSLQISCLSALHPLQGSTLPGKSTVVVRVPSDAYRALRLKGVNQFPALCG